MFREDLCFDEKPIQPYISCLITGSRTRPPRRNLHFILRPLTGFRDLCCPIDGNAAIISRKFTELPANRGRLHPLKIFASAGSLRDTFEYTCYLFFMNFFEEFTISSICPSCREYFLGKIRQEYRGFFLGEVWKICSSTMDLYLCRNWNTWPNSPIFYSIHFVCAHNLIHKIPSPSEKNRWKDRSLHPLCHRRLSAPLIRI